jgi:hypothetical protein
MYSFNQPPDEIRLPEDLGLDIGPEASLVIAAWRFLILGFADVDDFVEEVREEFGLPDHILRRAFETVLDVRRAQQRGFGDAATTPLTRAFAELNDKGILALEGYSCCAECGVREIAELLDDQTPRRGYVFYHQGDAEHLLDHSHVDLTYGAVMEQILDPDEFARLLPEGKQWWFEQVSVEFFRDEVMPVLAAHGINVEWNRTFDSRPTLTNVDFYAPV